MNWKDAYKAVANIGNRGQLSPLNLIGFFVIVVIMASLMNPIMDMLDIANASGLDTVTSSILYLIPMMLVVAVVITLFSYARPYTAG